MDEIDFSISMLLMVNSRIPYRELAEIFNMSVNSIHKRVKALVDLGVIQKFKARLGVINFPNISNIIMFGTPDVKNKKKLINKLGASEYIYNVTQSAGNLFYIHAYIRNLKDLDSLVSFVRKTGNIKELTVGIDKGMPPIDLEDLKNKTLSDLDYLIINSLKDNSRKTISEIADEVGVSTKTVKRRLDRLIDNFLIQFLIDWYPDKTGEVLSIIILRLNPDNMIDDNEFINKLREKYGSKILFSWSFSNLPNLKLISVWTKSMKELQNLQSSFLSENYESVEVTVLFEGKMFPTWIDTYLKDKIKEIKSQS